MSAAAELRPGRLWSPIDVLRFLRPLYGLTLAHFLNYTVLLETP